MRLGSDAVKLPGAGRLTPVEQLQQASERGLHGLYFRSTLHLSPTLDPGYLREIRDCADDLGLYLESGLGKTNPYALAESPELRALGDGDTLLGFRKIIEACSRIGVYELWSATGGIKNFPGYHMYDRFRTDVPWDEQLEGIERLLKRLAPIARDNGVHINLETHEEITSFELVHLIEEVGPDVVGITYDTANPLQRGEVPEETARRVAPYVRQTHIKDAVLIRAHDGFKYQSRPNGQGVVDLNPIIPLLAEHNPDLNLSLEVAFVRAEGVTFPDLASQDVRSRLELNDPVWRAGHPDLSDEELAEFVRLGNAFSDRVDAGEVPGFDEFDRRVWGEKECWEWVSDSHAYVLDVCRRHGIALEGPEEAKARLAAARG
ncbi:MULTISPECIES: sugar phosphate isomerase/epimerase [Arthrobacter]|uniref:Sugar phosphate isomerase/epimerase n=2 Tax=Arthrobacter TaxID=1663 RepID=A0ABU9KL49_9MICC|nr:sugar phosphate isomerase/epimerase [Arthrobacter sp. YJM1]MDP5227631.1 sugar phosphate isomerase/epimerase [Arthrobacter sp. YJM1]